jgi:hypothetical protein
MLLQTVWNVAADLGMLLQTARNVAADCLECCCRLFGMLLQTARNVAADCCHEHTFCTTENSALKSSSVADCITRYNGFALDHSFIYFISNSRNIQFPKSVASVG